MGRAGAELGEGDLAGSSSEGKGLDLGFGFERNRESSVQGSQSVTGHEREWGKLGWGEREGIRGEIPSTSEFETRQGVEYVDNSERGMYCCEGTFFASETLGVGVILQDGMSLWIYRV